MKNHVNKSYAMKKGGKIPDPDLPDTAPIPRHYKRAPPENWRPKDYSPWEGLQVSDWKKQGTPEVYGETREDPPMDSQEKELYRRFSRRRVPKEAWPWNRKKGEK